MRCTLVPIVTATFQEYGTVRQPAPFLRPSVELVVQQKKPAEIVEKYGRQAMEKEFGEGSMDLRYGSTCLMTILSADSPLKAKLDTFTVGTSPSIFVACVYQNKTRPYQYLPDI